MLERFHGGDGPDQGTVVAIGTGAAEGNEDGKIDLD